MRDSLKHIVDRFEWTLFEMFCEEELNDYSNISFHLFSLKEKENEKLTNNIEPGFIVSKLSSHFRYVWMFLRSYFSYSFILYWCLG